jgi:DNA-binding transcriptional LysR family regulator
MAQLERHLGATLLVRSTRRLELTQLGRSFLAASERILHDVEEAEALASDAYQAPRGDLSLTAPVAFGRLRVLPVVAEFLKAYPEVNVHLTLTDHSLDLLEERIDAAIRIGRLPESRLVPVHLGEVRNIVCASPSLLERSGVPTKPEHLSTRDCITFSALAGIDTWVFGRMEIRVKSRLVVTTAEAATDAAIAGIGFTRVLSYQASEACAAGSLRIVLARFEPPPTPVHLVYHRHFAEPAKLRAFSQFAVPRLRERLARVDRPAGAARSLD